MSSFVEGLTSPEVEIAEGGAIVDNKARFADLKAMLDSSKDSLKMDAMKRIINLVAKGRDVSELFPAVVKNVAAKNLELKKLVYVYLVRYAEEQQDLALLSISTFQRALKDPNQLIRASALRVLSSIRVQMIAPILLLAIRDSVRDMSAYVRKVAAHAIPKLYSLDESLQHELIDCIDFLLGDKRTLVLGSAVYAFEETCPDHFHLIHRHYRSLCKALADVDEWGQITMIGLLTRYARSQFAAPTNTIDPDLGLLLNTSRPLLQSRNCAVVMAVAQLFYHCAPQSQVPIISKALIRLLRSPREVQNVVLLNIATICSVNPQMFEPYLKSFFVRPTDPAYIKVLKLQVMTSLVTETNVQILLRELQTYVGMSELADAAIDAIGQCAILVKSVAESCLMRLVSLIASSNENIVSAAVVTLKRLLHSNAPLPLLTRVLRLIDSVKAPQARACVVWLVATHVDKVPLLAPDMLRIMAKTFVHEKEIVKLQTMNLAARLWLINPEECKQLVLYVMQLARFDQSYDIRDRCRFLRNLLFVENKLTPFAKEIFFTEKPSPIVQNSFKDREQFQLGTLSHFLNQRCARYRDLPPFPEVTPDPSVRGIVEPSSVIIPDSKLTTGIASEVAGDFYSDEEDSGGGSNDEDQDEDEEEDEEDEEDEEEEETDESGSEEYEDEKEQENQLLQGNEIHSASNIPSQKKSANLDLLLDLDFDLAPGSNIFSNTMKSDNSFKELLNHAAWPVGVSVSMNFIRESSVSFPTMNTVLLRFVNTLSSISPSLTLVPKKMESNETSGVLKIGELGSESEKFERIFIDFGDSGRSSEWVLKTDDNTSVTLTIEAPIGEQMYPIIMNIEQFNESAAQLTGLNEHIVPMKIILKPQQLLEFINCANIIGSEVNFCARTLSKKQLILISLGQNELCVRSESVVLGSLLCNFIIKKAEALKTEKTAKSESLL